MMLDEAAANGGAPREAVPRPRLHTGRV